MSKNTKNRRTLTKKTYSGSQWEKQKVTHWKIDRYLDDLLITGALTK